ncbi:MAG: hypothetical protein Q8O03_07970 [Nanoarchaeota archaeon]|nr:hypothetical protein [Nanoarchaeota archaeon]
MIYTFETLAKADKKTLDDVMKNGTMPDLESMAGFEFDGYNLTFMATILGIRKFRKGFYKYKIETEFFTVSGKYAGYNVKMKQNKFEQPWEYKNGKPERFGWFNIFKDYSFGKDGLDIHPNAALLHYGLDERNTLFEGKMLRDYLVQVNDNDKDLYLGKAYNAIGKSLVMPSYFIIKRAEKVNF